MRALTLQEIKQLASRPGARRIAVENFLTTMGDDKEVAIVNWALDSKSYGWNDVTRGAIIAGIKLASLKSV